MSRMKKTREHQKQTRILQVDFRSIVLKLLSKVILDTELIIDRFISVQQHIESFLIDNLNFEMYCSDSVIRVGFNLCNFITGKRRGFPLKGDTR